MVFSLNNFSKLGENIIQALLQIKCPYRLQAQQIQGLDYISLFPVVQWMIKKVIEYREETGDLVRMFSVNQFEKDFELPEDSSYTENVPVTFFIFLDCRLL